MAHTKEDWVIVKNHPVFKYDTLIMADFKDCGKVVKQAKLICKIIDIHGDSFTRLSLEEREANINLIISAPSMKHELNEIEFYAKTALKSLDDKSLAEVRGMLEGIITKAKSFE